MLTFIVLASLVLTIIGVPSNVQALSRTGWPDPATLLETGAGNAYYPQVAMDDDGNAVVVWYQYDGSFYSVYANRYSAGAWGTATLLEDDIRDAIYPQVAMDDDGNAVAVWQQHDGSYLRVYANRYSAGAWGTATLLENSTGYASYPQVSLDDDGNALAVWQQVDGSYTSVYANWYSAGAWGTVTLLGNSTGYAYCPQVSLNDDDNAVAVWYQQDGSASNIYGKNYAPLIVTIETPLSGITVYSPTIQVTGTTNPGTSLVINGFVVSLGSDGHFSVVIPLLEGSNTITATASDIEQGIASSSITVTYVDENSEQDQNISDLNDELNAINERLDEVNAKLNGTIENLTLAIDQVTAAQEALISLRDSLYSTDSNASIMRSDLVLSNADKSALSTLLNQTIADLETAKTNLTAMQASLDEAQDARESDGTTYLLLCLTGIILAVAAIALIFLRTRGPKGGQP